MSVDRTKILEAAQKHLAKGAYDKAIVEFQKLVKADPSDVRTWLKIGDLHAKKGSTRDAIDTYARVADQYAAQGFFLKAVAVHKQILKLDPTRLDVQLKLAEAYENLQLVSDALITYEQVAGSYARAGNIDKALETLGKMAELDPENIPVRIKYAEALSKANRTKEAADAFEVGGRLLKAQGRLDDWIKVAERLLFHRADDVAIARELSQLYLERQDAKRALAKLQICFKADPKDVPTLEMLAEAFRQLGQLPKTISVHREVARIHQEAGRAEERARTLKRILELDPGDAEARQALASYAQPAPAPAPVRRDVAPPPGAVVAARGEPIESEPPLEDDEPAEEMLEELDELEDESMGDEDDAEADALYADADDGGDDVIIVEDEDAPREVERELEPAPARVSSRAPASSSVLPPEIARDAQIAKLMTECEVFLRYGLKQKVLDQLRRVLDLDPGHVEARERLKDLLIERGELHAAMDELFVLADLFADERASVAMLYLRQILELDPEHPDAQERLAFLAARAGSSHAPPRARDEVADEFDDHTVFDRGGPPPDDGVFFVDDEEAAMAEREAELRARGQRVAVPPPAAADYDDELPEESTSGAGDPLAPMSPEEFENAPLRPSTPHAHADDAARMSMPPGEVEELLDEADFFVAQGLYEEARAILRDSLAAHPRNLLIADKLSEIDEIAEQSHAQSRSEAPSSSDLSFELAEKLAEDLGQAEHQERNAGSGVLDVEQVFAQFKKGVEQQVGLEDTETHFDLGIAYKEMGLLTDAMAEFQLCLANPQKTCIAHTMIGLCHLEKNEVSDAIGQFKKGLYVDTKTDREELGLYYELGRAYELLHDPKEALYYFEKVRKREPGFRNVNDRIVALTRPSAATATAPVANDDIDAAFDDLMGDRES